MKDHPLLFSAPMILANLDDRKTQTRRALNPQPTPLVHCSLCGLWSGEHAACEEFICGDLVETGASNPKVRYAVGDRLWIRESWRTTDILDGLAPSRIKETETSDVPYTPIRYEADGAVVDFDPHCDPRFGKLRPGIFLPRWASRLTAMVEEVRVERLQDISEEDARAEGFPISANGKPYDPPPPEVDRWQGYARASFFLTWNELNAARGFGVAANPFVVAVSYRLERRNIDEVAA